MTKQTVDDILENMYITALSEQMLKPRHIGEAKEALLQLVLDAVSLMKKPDVGGNKDSYADLYYEGLKTGYNDALDDVSQRAREMFEI